MIDDDNPYFWWALLLLALSMVCIHSLQVNKINNRLYVLEQEVLYYDGGVEYQLYLETEPDEQGFTS